jgi:phosphoglycolate phosphatase
MKTALIFEMDGTLADSYASLSASLKYVYSRLEEARKQMQSEPEKVDPSLKAPQSLWPLNDRGTILDPVLGQYKEQLKQGADRVPEVYDVIYKLSAEGRQIAICSRKPVKLTERLTRNLGLDDFLVGVYGPESVGDPNPHAGMIMRAMTDMGVRREELLFIGDLPEDVDAARSAGVRVALVTSAASRSAYAMGAPDYLVDNWTQILSLPL